jgi:hypothetical protein
MGLRFQIALIFVLTFMLNEVYAARLNFSKDQQTEYDFIRIQLARIDFNPVNAFQFVLQRNESVQDADGKYAYEMEIHGREGYFRLGRDVSKLLDSISLNKGRLQYSTQQHKQEVHQVMFNGTLYYLRSNASMALIQSFFESIWLSALDVRIVNVCGEVLPHESVSADFTPLNVYLFRENTAMGHVTVVSLVSLDRSGSSVIHESDMESFKSENAIRLDNEVFDYSVLNAIETNTVKRILIYDGIRYSEKEMQQELDCTFSIAYSNDGTNVSKFSSFNGKMGSPPFENTALLLQLNSPSFVCNRFVASQYDLQMSIRTTDRIVLQSGNHGASTHLNELGFPPGKYSLRERSISINDSLFHATQIMRYRAYGWENGLLTAVVPGLGMKRVSSSTQKSVLCFGMVALPAVFALSAEAISQRYFSKYYNESSDSPIGTSFNYVRANSWHKASLISTGAALLGWMFQFSWVIKLGIENDIQEKMIQSEIQTNKLIYVDEFNEHVQF